MWWKSNPWISKSHLLWLSKPTLKEEGSKRTNTFSSIGMRYGCTSGGSVHRAIGSIKDLLGRHDREMMRVEEKRWDAKIRDG